MSIKKLRRSRTALVGVCCALVGAAAVPVLSLAGSITGSTGDGPMVLQSGSSFPTYEGLSNVSSVTAANPYMWMRVGDTVHVEGTMTLTPSAGSGQTRVFIPVPVDSNINGNGNCNGVATIAAGTTKVAGDIGGSQAAGHTHQCLLEYYNTASTTTNYVHYTLTYRVVD